MSESQTFKRFRRLFKVKKEIEQLLDFGWSTSVVKQFCDVYATKKKTDYFKDWHLGSQDFLFLWELERKLPKNDDKKLIKIVLNYLNFPEELLEDKAEVRRLLDLFSESLSPKHFFWTELAKVVNEAFSSLEMPQNTLLAKQVHQLRYVISCQQAYWIRQFIGENDQSDEEKLILYLSTLHPNEYQLNESSRLHNKGSLTNRTIMYPDGEKQLNVKILIHFHTEFILDASGHFLNVLDERAISLNGIINGASFNYACKNDSRHKELDILPTGPHDPLFRRKAIRKLSYRSPNLEKKWWKSEWQFSYFNPFGLYASHKKSLAKHVKKRSHYIKKRVKRLK